MHSVELECGAFPRLARCGVVLSRDARRGQGATAVGQLLDHKGKQLILYSVTLNAFSTYSVFNLQWVYLDVTHHKLRSICAHLSCYYSQILLEAGKILQ